ncbi:MAG: hypothetical protein J0M15_15835 [Deltaproteobacteria bacterium]|jgi:hypothetical protein|nr:hypothetical protein [Deltaproteobacteria bacterium]
MESDSNENKKNDFKNDFEAKSLIGETLKKVFTTGVSAAFMTEESIRSYLQELKLPKEILNILIQSANKSKDELTQRVSKEISQIFNKIDWVSEMAKFAESHKFKISAEIDIVKKENKTSETEKL